MRAAVPPGRPLRRSVQTSGVRPSLRRAGQIPISVFFHRPAGRQPTNEGASDPKARCPRHNRDLKSAEWIFRPFAHYGLPQSARRERPSDPPPEPWSRTPLPHDKANHTWELRFVWSKSTPTTVPPPGHPQRKVRKNRLNEKKAKHLWGLAHEDPDTASSSG